MGASTWAVLVTGEQGAMAKRPLDQCTANMATNTVIINGPVSQRTAKPIINPKSPIISVAVAITAMNQGKGSPSPHYQTASLCP